MSEKLVHLIVKLTASTERGQRSWEQTALPDSYHTSFPNHVISIRQNSDPLISEPTGLRLTIQDIDGRMIESVSDEDLAQEWTESKLRMKRLFDVARESALGVERVLDDIMSQI